MVFHAKQTVRSPVAGRSAPHHQASSTSILTCAASHHLTFYFRLLFGYQNVLFSLRRAPRPLGLLLPGRGFPSGGAGGSRKGVGLSGSGPDGPQRALRLHGVRPGRQGGGASAHHRGRGEHRSGDGSGIGGVRAPTSCPLGTGSSSPPTSASTSPSWPRPRKATPTSAAS